MAVDVRYKTSATAWGGRQGKAKSHDGKLDIYLTTPVELGGPGGDGTNPEQLFALGYAGCFHSALKLVARSKGVDLTDSAVSVEVGIGLDDSDGGFGLTVAIEAEMPGINEALALELVELAHQTCPYSKATMGNIKVTLTVTSE
ncbi:MULTISPECIES: organic hydroperoxide resistance protein [Acidithrix]|uniref:Organic hydroperoxide resistance protein OhrB n=2 Tax=root TaxID=1 RepID=A0A0D8HI96_9ACTN|nr:MULTISPECIES: organic hydroperoxide resistance protein [Acidithrix]ATZ76346.1 Ohr subfamily peroxiredoxin [uncultured Acidithrix sp.]ATZ76357.1 Ohr subfamily peroxiredoxin [uncultured Acidithrix sp.]KJF17574.1 organic hydroperoxide resistance protein OhrB [Acidithrix ferrooxidans]CAG4927662.1 unnamed protein product [Acidithrix sp. C25]